MSSPTQGMWTCRHNVDGRDFCPECMGSASLRGLLRWAPYQEFGIPDPAAEVTRCPVGLIRIMATGYRDDDIIVYWVREGTLNRDQLDYLAGLVRMDIRKRERALAKFAPKDGQDPAEAEAVRGEQAAKLAWKREVLEALRSARKQGTP